MNEKLWKRWTSWSSINNKGQWEVERVRDKQTGEWNKVKRKERTIVKEKVKREVNVNLDYDEVN